MTNIKELTASKNDDHITCVGVLAWAKRVEAQRAQTAVLNTLTESKQPELQYTRPHSNSHADTVGESTSQGSAQHMARHMWSGE